MVLNGWRIFFYRLCGYNIGKNVFIGMRCYLDDLEPHMFTVEDDCIISYGVFFACHGRNQKHTGKDNDHRRLKRNKDHSQKRAKAS